MKALFVAWIALVALCVLQAAAQKTLLMPGEPYYEFEPGELLVKLRTDQTAAQAEALFAALGDLPLEQSAELGFWRVRCAKPERDAVRLYRARPEVEWANFNYIAHAFFTPNDPNYTYQWHYPRINMPAAWDITQGVPGVVVAVADMGYYFNHADFMNVPMASPRDFVDGDNNPVTSVNDSHGEHVAGTILARTNNGIGVAGIAPGCTFMPIRCLNDSGSGNASNIANAISWAATHDADVLNLSLGFHVSGPPQDPGQPITGAVQQAASAGLIICAASGNDGQGYVAYPAAYEVCIAVGATGYDDALAPYSNRGTALDVVAPGGNTDQDLNSDGYVDGVLSLTRSGASDTYSFWQGTSMATPHATGVVALLLSNGLAPQHVREALQATAQDLGPAGWDVNFGYGRINAQAALGWSPGGGTSEITLLEEGFEAGYPPANWEVYANGVTSPNWVALAGNSDADGGSLPHGGANAAFHNDDDVAADSARDWLITPFVSIPANATAAQVRFFQRNFYMTAQYYGRHALLYSVNGSTYTTLGSYAQDQPAWAEVSVDVTSLAGQSVQFAFYYVGDYGSEWYIDDVRVTATVPGAAGDEPAAAPRLLTLGDAFPNPFNNSTVIPLELSVPARVELAVYNLLGQRVATLAPMANLGAGTHRFVWDARQQASGVYLVRLTGDAALQTRKIVLIK